MPDALIDLNLKGLLHCTSAALTHMRRQGEGCIIGIASRAGRQGEPELAVYSATKADVLAFTRALAQEVRADGVRVIAICPGPVDTQRMRRLAPDADRGGRLQPEDVAHAVVFLSSAQAMRYNRALLDLFAGQERIIPTRGGMRLKDKVAIISGAGSGIGRAAAAASTPRPRRPSSAWGAFAPTPRPRRPCWG